MSDEQIYWIMPVFCDCDLESRNVRSTTDGYWVVIRKRRCEVVWTERSKVLKRNLLGSFVVKLVTELTTCSPESAVLWTSSERVCPIGYEMLVEHQSKLRGGATIVTEKYHLVGSSRTWFENLPGLE
jgi:hypothetical protein